MSIVKGSPTVMPVISEGSTQTLPNDKTVLNKLSQLLYVIISPGTGGAYAVTLYVPSIVGVQR